MSDGQWGGCESRCAHGRPNGIDSSRTPEKDEAVAQNPGLQSTATSATAKWPAFFFCLVLFLLLALVGLKTLLVSVFWPFLLPGRSRENPPRGILAAEAPTAELTASRPFCNGKGRVSCDVMVESSNAQVAANSSWPRGDIYLIFRGERRRRATFSWPGVRPRRQPVRSSIASQITGE